MKKTMKKNSGEEIKNIIIENKKMSYKISNWFYFNILEKIRRVLYFFKNWNSNCIKLKEFPRGEYIESNMKMRAATCQIFLEFMDSARKNEIENKIKILTKVNFKNLDSLLKAEKWFKTDSKKLIEESDKIWKKYCAEVDLLNERHGKILVSPKKTLHRYNKILDDFEAKDLKFLKIVIENINSYWY